MRIDTHVHTIYSKHWFFGVDAISTPRQVVKTAIKKGLDGIAITDHNNIKGGLAGKKAAKEFKGFKVIPGVEVQTKQGDLLALNINENVPRGLNLEETIEKVHDLGGIAIAPHPFGVFLFRNCLEERALKADAIEVLNSGSCLKFQNNKARMLAEKYKKPMTASSDSHYFLDVGNAGIICNDIYDIKKRGKVKLFFNRTPFHHTFYTFVYKLCRSAAVRLNRRGYEI